MSDLSGRKLGTYISTATSAGRRAAQRRTRALATSRHGTETASMRAVGLVTPDSSPARPPAPVDPRDTHDIDTSDDVPEIPLPPSEAAPTNASDNLPPAEAVPASAPDDLPPTEVVPAASLERGQGERR